MAPEYDVANLQDRALEMGRYYHKGFGGSIDGILSDVELYSTKKSKPVKRQAYRKLEKIERFYSGIPFDKLRGKEEFYPLFVVRMLLSQFRKTIESILSGNSFYTIQDLNEKATTIRDVGNLYRTTLKNILGEIRSTESGKEFKLQVRGPERGVDWDFDDA